MISEPIAIVGISCRLPQASSPEQFWRLLADGVDAITDVPDGRWNTETLTGLPEDRAIRRGGFLDQVDGFDADFFRTSPRESVSMDPQQRLMLELGWEALEDARIAPHRLRGSQAGVFVGAIWDDYATLLHRGGIAAITQHSLTGVHRSMIANRLSYVLGLHGPSLAVDGGQSSSLIAVHMACDSLTRGESSLALAGG
ncbi:MAG: polyketide synthase, partial [Trebonia sp.]